MDLHWLLFIFVIMLGNFLCLGAMLIGLGNFPATAVGIRYLSLGRSRRLSTIVATFLFQTIIAVALSTLILTWFYYINGDRQTGFLATIVAAAVAIYPSWQTWSLARYERVAEPEGYLPKIAAHKAVPWTFFVTLTLSLAFIFLPELLDIVFPWLMAASGATALIGIGVIFISIRRSAGDH